ncbi:MAG: nucleotidyl transferase AbiEii/AbiGii toxin family protein [Bryobacteraceae bacterium]
MGFDDVRKLTITALFSDDLLYEQLVLKGGNGMSLVLGISPRASLDLDFSLEKDFENLPDIQDRMERALADRFASVGFVPLDVKLVPRPSNQSEESVSRWGGYRLEFKLIDEKGYRFVGPEKARLRREALVVGPKQMRVFTVDFSKWEYTAGKVRADLDDYAIYVYTPAMIALEKVRAICQQMEEYAPTGKTKCPRARDFFDIHTIVTKTGFRFDSAETPGLTKLIFAAKEVPLSLLGKIKDQREFHRVDWPSVRAAVVEPLEEFDFYFEFVLREMEPLHALWME